eukprot:3695513-Rhodomonas_salina.1
MRLSANMITQVPEQISHLTSLDVMQLASNQLKKLPVEMGVLSDLRELDVSNNPLEVPPPEVVASGCEKTIEYLFRFLEGKRTNALNLNAMGLRSVPPEVFELSGLTSLALCENKLERLPEDMRLLTKLE